MKKLQFIVAVLFLSLQGIAQQTEDDPSVGGHSRTFGKFKGTPAANLNTLKGQVLITGTVISVSWCEEDCLTVLVKTNTGNIVSIGTKDNAFSVPKNIAGKKITIEGYEQAKLTINKKVDKNQRQKDIQVAATGIKIYE